MSAASDRTAYLRYCTTSASTTCICCPKTVDISGQTVIADISGQTVIADISGQTVIADISGQTVALDLTTGLGDAFSRLRVSNPYTLMEFNSILDQNPLYIDTLTSGGGSVTHSSNSYVSMIVPATVGARVVRQTHEYVLYQPGKSKLVLMTGVLYTTEGPENITARIGAFDDEMGVFIQKTFDGISVVLRKGSSDANTVIQANWNVNSLTGVDFTKAQIFLFDFEWLGVGVVRCGLVINGEIVYYHVFNRNNPLQEPYIPMAKLPLRYEIVSNGSANEMRMICGTVISEGGITLLGKEFTKGIYTYDQRINVSSGSGNPYVPLMALRLRDVPRVERATIKIKGIDVFSADANKFGSWQLLLNPAGITATSWIDVDLTNGSVAQVAFNNTAGTALTITAGTGFALYTNYYSTRINSTIETTTDALVAAYPITTDISGVPDTVVLVANHIASGADTVSLYASMRWLELI